MNNSIENKEFDENSCCTLPNTEREVAIGWVSADDFIRVDIDYGKDNNKYIKICDEIVAEGKGTVVIADKYHKSYKINKGVLKFFVKKTTRNFSEEQIEALKERMSKANKKENT